MAGLYDITEPVDARFNVFQYLFFVIQLQFKALFKEWVYFFLPVYKLIDVVWKQQEIIDVAQVKLNFKMVFYELVQLIEIHICKELGSEITNRQSLVFGNMEKGFVGRNLIEKFLAALCREIVGGIVEDDDFYKIQYLGIFNLPADYIEKDFFLEAHKKSGYIQMKKICFLPSVFGDFLQKFAQVFKDRWMPLFFRQA